MKSMRKSHVVVFLAGCAVAWTLSAFFSSEVIAQEKEGTTEQVTTSEDGRFFMLNALWFKEDGGAAKYTEYMAAAGPFVEKYGGKSEGAYVPEASLIGEFDADLVFFVEWPNQKAFEEFIADPGYQAVSHLRGEAISDSLLVKCRRM